MAKKEKKKKNLTTREDSPGNRVPPASRTPHRRGRRPASFTTMKRKRPRSNSNALLASFFPRTDLPVELQPARLQGEEA
jgi:hypothetical protein